MAPDELLTEIRVPKMPGAGFSYQKFQRRAQDWAIVGALAIRNGDARVALVNMGSTPLRATAVEQRLASGASIADAAQRAAEATDPPSDLNGSSEYREHLAHVLVQRRRWRPRLAELHWMALVDHRLCRMAGDDGEVQPVFAVGALGIGAHRPVEGVGVVADEDPPPPGTSRKDALKRPRVRPRYITSRQNDARPPRTEHTSVRSAPAVEGGARSAALLAYLVRASS